MVFLQSGCLRTKSKTAFLFRTFIIYRHAPFIITIVVIIHEVYYNVKGFYLLLSKRRLLLRVEILSMLC